MVSSLTFTENTDNVSSKIVKEDNTNTDILVLTVPESTTIGIGDTITYKDKAATTIFKGIVQNYKVGNGLKTVEVYDLGAELLQRIVNQIFTSQSPEAIISTVLSTYTSLTYVSTISSGVTIDSYVAKDKKAWDIVTEMAEILLANFYVDVSGNFQLELEGDTTSTKNITTSNAVLDGAWNYDISQQVNSVTIQGDRLLQEKVESFAGPATQVSLAEIPIDVYVTVGGTEKTGYIDGSSTGDYTVDRENKNIDFDSSSSTIVVTYTFEIPIKIRRRDAASISTYGQKDKKFEKPYIKSRDEARNYASFILGRYANPLQSSKWKISSTSDYEAFTSFLPNNIIPVTDSLNSISGNFIIKKVERSFPGDLFIHVGTPEDDLTFWNKEVQTRIKQLEEKDDNSSILNEDEYVEENVSVDFAVSISDCFLRTYDADTFYWQETGGTRNNWVEAGTGDVFRENTGFTDEPCFTTFLNTEAGELLITEAGDFLIEE